MRKKITVEYNNTQVTISTFDHVKMHRTITRVILDETNNLVSNCYYPKIVKTFDELYSLAETNERLLTTYGKAKYPNIEFQKGIVRNPKTIFLILIIQEFLKVNDVIAAQSTYRFLTLMQYTNLLHKYIKYCNEDYFRTALSMLSHNHLYVQKGTISNAVMYLSDKMFSKYQSGIVSDDAFLLEKMIKELRTRMNQTVRSFANKYYEVSEKKSQIKNTDDNQEMFDGEVLDRKVRSYTDMISKDICIYRKRDEIAIKSALMETKFNKKLAQEYVAELENVKYLEDVKMSIYLLMKPLKDLEFIKSPSFMNHVQQLMSIKVSKQPVYFKLSVTKLHDEIIKSLSYVEWYQKLSVQSQSISRKFIAYYLAYVVRSYY